MARFFFSHIHITPHCEKVEPVFQVLSALCSHNLKLLTSPPTVSFLFLSNRAPLVLTSLFRFTQSLRSQKGISLKLTPAQPVNHVAFFFFSYPLQCRAWFPTTGGTITMRYGGPGGGVWRACTNSEQAPGCASVLLPSQHQGPRQETSQEVLLVAVGFGEKTATTILDVRQVVDDKFILIGRKPISRSYGWA